MKKLILAISKGRILDEALEILEKSGVKCNESPSTSRKLIFKTNLKFLKIIIVLVVEGDQQNQHCRGPRGRVTILSPFHRSK